MLPLLVYSAITGLGNILHGTGGLSRAVRSAGKDFPWWTLALLAVTLWSFNVRRYFVPLDRTHRRALAAAAKAVPPEASVSAQFYLGPHVALRKAVFEFPDGLEDADYVFLDTKGRIYPFDARGEYELQVRKLTSDPRYQVVKEQDGVILLKKM